MNFQPCRIMRKLLVPLFVLFSLVSSAQLNNSWINYSQAYYKFQVGKTGIYRLGQATLTAAGLGAVPAEQFQLWRNGEQVRIYTSVTSGALGANDFIEFYGKRNDGIPDKPLFRIPDQQLTDSFSLHTDTASFFLTVSPGGTNLRYTNAVNDVTNNALPAEPYFMRRVEEPYKQQYNRGFANIVGEFVYSSSYDMGEGWTSNDVAPCCDLSKVFSNLNVYTAGPQNSVSFYIAAFGNALYTRNMRVKFFNTVIMDTAMNYFSQVKKQLDNLPLSSLQSPDILAITVGSTSTNQYDRLVVGTVAVTYPAKFNFNNANKFSFDLKESPAGNFLVIDNFNTGAEQPILYSESDGKRYLGDISVAGKVRFALPPSSDPNRKFILLSQEATNIGNVKALTPRNFINYSDVANQGNYLIITHPSLYNDGSGNNWVEQYRAYRASAAGGSFNPKIIPIDDLTDQFGFGIKKHPSSIRDFLRFATEQFSVAPRYTFLIGRGMSNLEYQQFESDPLSEKLNLVPSFGWPASDILLAAKPGEMVPMVPIGRLSVVNGLEIKNYLNKVKEYEAVQASPSQTVADKAWMKNIIHAAGGRDSTENALFVHYLNIYRDIAKDSAMGAYVETFKKESNSAVVQAEGERIEQLINEGVSVVGYFGHSSANTLAFNLNEPQNYANVGKYPFFNVSGCSAGNNYIFDAARLAGNMSISEKYVLADQRGSIGFLASTHLGIPPFLNFYNTELYDAFSRTLYGGRIGDQIKETIKRLSGNIQSLDYYTRIHLEEVNLNGDPAIRINSFAKPDYVIEDQLIKISPSIITVADNNFTIAAKILNIGRVGGDSIRLTVSRRFANDTVQVVYNQLLPAIKYADSLELTIPISSITDKGLNRFTFMIDSENKTEELSETNNSFTKEIFIFEDEVRPVSPYNFSIVNQQNITYTASTANPLNGPRQYVMEIDTTELFNSTFKKQYTSSGIGGLLQFNPTNVTFQDSTVYYWRTSMLPLNNAQQIWNTFSFIYLPNGGTGFNQSHYFQHQKSKLDNAIKLDADRVFRFKEIPRSLVIKTGLHPYTSYDRINVNLDFDQLEYYGCKYGSLQFLVYDTVTLQPWKNFNTTGPSGTTGRFGSLPLCDVYADGSRYFFEFSYTDAAGRKKAMDFIDSIPSGMYVSITNLGWNALPSNITDWQADQATLGTGNSLYHKFKSIGFSSIDNFTKNLPFMYFFRKNSSTFTPIQKIGALESDYLETTIELFSKYDAGVIESPVFGPAKKWSSLHWRASSVDAGPGDTSRIEVVGITANKTEQLLATVSPAMDTSLAFIDPQVYRFVKLRMRNSDTEFATPAQLNFWRINADFVPEGVVAPNILYAMKDSVDQGEKITFSLAFKNISPVAFDSLAVKFIITDRNNTPNVVSIPRKKALVSNDTTVVTYVIDTKLYPGKNTLYVMFNPDNDQPEQYLSNNFLYKDFFVKEDKFNPLLDVTFDGVHILNRDIVSSRPKILVKLKDESRFLLLSDTALLKVKVHFPSDPVDVYRDFHFGNDMRFIPATPGGADNSASIDLSPFFPEDGEYELIVSGEDVVGNAAGKVEYKITFNVINTPMISNMLNYPNPFTTSTAFVFTITGSEVPQNIRIQVLTITGKVVREITKAELGSLHIGRNITEFKWDGTDMYGQRLANGVYLYRVLTNLNGKSLDKYKADGDNTDKYFNKGYGKMYLMK